MGSDTVAGVVVALCGVLTGLFSVMQSRRAGATSAAVEQQVAAPLTISPPLFAEYTERLAEGDRRESRLQELLRLSLRLVRRQNRRLTAAGLEPEPLPDELIPWSIS